MKKIGCFFGTFDPIHNGHLKLVDFFVHETDLDEILIIITPLNPLKSKSITTKEDRLKMAKISLLNKKNIRISKIEFLMNKPNYTINTLNELSRLKPENKEEKRLVNVILGVTNNWYKIEEYIGFNNILYIGFLLFISYIMDNSLIYVLPIFIQHIINNNYENFMEENKQIKYNCIKDYVKKKDILSNTLERDIDIYKCLSYLNIIYILYYGMYTYIVIYFIMLYNGSYIFDFVNNTY